MKKSIVILGLLIGFCCSYAENKNFIREYTYQASESDSKISARSNALAEVKRLLLEELGVYMESYVNYTVEEQNYQITKDFFVSEIKQMSAGITETKILDESWNGEQYFVRAEISVDPTDVIRRINQTLEKRQSDVVIDSLNILLTNMKQNVEGKNAEIIKLNQQLQDQTTTNQTQQHKVDSLSKQLASLRAQLTQQKQEEKQIISEIDKIIKNLQNVTARAVENARVGMSPEEVKRVCGEPRIIEKRVDDIWYNYGYVWLGFQDGVLLVAIPVEKRIISSYTVGMYLNTSNNLLKR